MDYILYSASFSGTPDEYAEGMLVNDHPPQPGSKGNALTNPAAWVKVGPLFDGHHASYGTASSVLVPSPDGTEIWNVYHGTDCLTHCYEPDGKSWPDRSDRVQKAGWSADGELVMGYPYDVADTDGTGRAVALAVPSTGGKGSRMLPAWGAAFGDAAEGDDAHGLAVGKWEVVGAHAISSLSEDAGVVDQMFFVANPNWQDDVVSTKVQMTGAGGTHAAFGVYGAYVDHENYFSAVIDVSGCPKPGCLVTDAVVKGVDKGALSCALPAEFETGKVNELEVQAVSGTFTVAVNGVALGGACQKRKFELDGGQISSNGSNGQAGVLVRDALVKYTDFRVVGGAPLDSKKFDRVYGLRNVASRMNLDACGGDCGKKVSEGAAVVQFGASAPYPLTIAKSQVWLLKERGDGVFALVSALDGMCLEVSPSAAGIVQKKCNDGSGQRWRFRVAAEGGGFVVENETSHLVLDGVGEGEGAQVEGKVGNRSGTQVWQVVAE